jgi:hypothetical protein
VQLDRRIARKEISACTPPKSGLVSAVAVAIAIVIGGTMGAKPLNPMEPSDGIRSPPKASVLVPGVVSGTSVVLNLVTGVEIKVAPPTNNRRPAAERSPGEGEAANFVGWPAEAFGGLVLLVMGAALARSLRFSRAESTSRP